MHMAADASSLMRFFNGGDANESAKSTAEMITRDLLGGCGSNISSLESKELDLDLQVPCGWEKCLDLKSGQVYLQRCNSSSSISSQSNTVSKSKDLINFPRKPKQTLNLFGETTLDLKLVSSPSSTSIHQSMCTLDKVKFALERAEKKTYARKRSLSSITNMSSSQRSNSSSSSIKDGDNFTNDEERFMSRGSFAVGCPCCLSYVLISSCDRKCPRCNSNVPLPEAVKKPRIDLNGVI